MQLRNSCHLFITEFALRVDRLVRSNPNGPYNMHFGLVSAVSLRQVYRGSRICGLVAELSPCHVIPTWLESWLIQAFHLFFPFCTCFFFPFVFSPLLPVENCLPPPPPTCFARFCWTTSPGNQRYDHSDNLFLQQKSSKT